MTTDGQRAVIAFLSTPEAYLLRASLVERIDTHKYRPISTEGETP